MWRTFTNQSRAWSGSLYFWECSLRSSTSRGKTVSKSFSEVGILVAGRGVSRRASDTLRTKDVPRNGRRQWESLRKLGRPAVEAMVGRRVQQQNQSTRFVRMQGLGLLLQVPVVPPRPDTRARTWPRVMHASGRKGMFMGETTLGDQCSFTALVIVRICPAASTEGSTGLTQNKQ